MRTKTEWNDEAIRLANYISEHMHEAHRGAMPWTESGVSVLFGNDAYANDEDSGDNRSVDEVNMIRRALERRKKEILGFGVCDEGYAWVMLVRCCEVGRLDDLVWSAYPGNRVQWFEAKRAMYGKRSGLAMIVDWLGH